MVGPDLFLMPLSYRLRVGSANAVELRGREVTFLDPLPDRVPGAPGELGDHPQAGENRTADRRPAMRAGHESIS